jgi:hypothetical protein
MAQSRQSSRTEDHVGDQTGIPQVALAAGLSEVLQHTRIGVPVILSGQGVVHVKAIVGDAARSQRFEVELTKTGNPETGLEHALGASRPSANLLPMQKGSASRQTLSLVARGSRV